MIIVGGIYREICSNPNTSKLFGSGLKAACAISGMTKNVELYGFVNESDILEARAIANTYRVKFNPSLRQRPMGFHYFTPLNKPEIYGLGEQYSLSVRGQNILAFGMLECESDLDAEMVVFDPQSPRGTTFRREKIKCVKLALVLNKDEAKSLSNELDIPKAAGILMEKYNADVVVIKCGALGAFVKDVKIASWIGVYPSNSVWPIGSGDIFSAAFSIGWMEKQLSPIDAAKFASKAVSTWTQAPDFFPLIESEIVKRTFELSVNRSRIYLAGPFFNLGQNWMIEVSKSSLESLGAEVFSPVHQVGHGGDEVAILDLQGIDSSNAVLALLDGLDTGTIFEIGYALAKGIKVVGFSENPNAVELKMIRGSGIPIYNDLSTAVYQVIWAGVK